MGALAREQAGKMTGRRASTRKAFSRSHALEGLVWSFVIFCLVSIDSVISHL